MAESCVSLTSQGHEEHHHWRLLPRHNWGARESHSLPKDWHYCSAAAKLSTGLLNSWRLITGLAPSFTCGKETKVIYIMRSSWKSLPVGVLSGEGNHKWPLEESRHFHLCLWCSWGQAEKWEIEAGSAPSNPLDPKWRATEIMFQ